MCAYKMNTGLVYIMRGLLVILAFVLIQFSLNTQNYVYYLRGIWGIVNNGLAIFALSFFIHDNIRKEKLLSLVTSVIWVVVLSAIVDYILVPFNEVHRFYRSIILIGTPIDAGVDVLSVNGASYNEVLRVGGIFGGPDNLGISLSFLLPLIFLIENHTRRLFLFLSIGLVAVMSASRILLAMLLIAFLIRRSGKGAPLRKIIVGLFVLLSVVILSYVIDLETVKSRLSYESVFEEQLIGWRLLFLMSGIDHIFLTLKDSFFGIGFAPLINETIGYRTWTLPDYFAQGCLGGDFGAALILGGIVGLILMVTYYAGLITILKHATFPLHKVNFELCTKQLIYVLILRGIYSPNFIRVFSIISSSILFYFLAFLILMESSRKQKYETGIYS
jgi:hypothetical protein